MFTNGYLVYSNVYKRAVRYAETLTVQPLFTTERSEGSFISARHPALHGPALPVRPKIGQAFAKLIIFYFNTESTKISHIGRSSDEL